MDRRKKFTPARRRVIYEGLKKNLPVELLCKKAGISKKTFYRWIEKGKKGEKGFDKFLEECGYASTVGAEAAMDFIIEAYPKDWKAAAWVLERRHDYKKEGKSLAQELEMEVSTSSERDESPKAILWNLCKELKESIEKARESGSWQAYAALQRTYLTTYREYREISAVNAEYEEMDSMSDEELLSQIKNVYLTLNPKLQHEIIDQIGAINSQVIPIKK
tara:strand:+ start:111 stop:767 length:657 start_codon:yes stop_codon:yes gene_type:complete